MSTFGYRARGGRWRGGGQETGGRSNLRGESRGSWQVNNSGRGNNRGRGDAWRGGGSGFRRPLEIPNWKLGPVLDSIEVDELLLSGKSPTISGVQYAASYTWLESDAPVIAIPGSPPFWAPPAGRKYEVLKQDSGDFYRDPNAARFPTYPSEPVVRALLSTQQSSSLSSSLSDIDLGSIDILACASTLGNLLRFSRSIPAVFRFEAEKIGDAVFLVRKENSPTELIRDVRGYGHTFPEAYTKWDEGLEKSVNHQRVIAYDFGGLKCLVRFGCDGYIKKNIPSSSTSSQSIVAKPIASIDDLSDLLSKSSTIRSGVVVPDFSGHPLKIKENLGAPPDQDLIFDIRTRHVTRKIDMEDILPRLWLTQTPGFLEANYDEPGRFLESRVRDVRDAIGNWEQENAGPLGKLHAVLSRVVDVVCDLDGVDADADDGTGIVEVSWKGEGPLLITKKIDGELSDGGQGVLPSDVAEQWRKATNGEF